MIIDKDNTTIIGGAGKKPDITGRIEQIRRQIEDTTSDYDKEKLQERLAKLTGGVAVLKVGAATEVEMKEKKARVDDAVHALRAAVEEGVVPGGGVALVRAMKAVLDLKLPEERKVGADIVARAMGEPLRQIAANAGREPEVISIPCARAKTTTVSTRAPRTSRKLNETGVIDPAKVVRTALENAVSAASLLITTEAAVAEKPRKAAPMGMPRRRNGRHGRYGWNGRHGWNGRYGWNGRHGWYGRNGRYGRRFLVIRKRKAGYAHRSTVA